MAWHPQIVQTVGSTLVHDEPDFLASEHFVAKRVGITVDASTVGADADGNKVLKKGTVMGEIATGGKYRAYSNGNSDGSETARGFLPESINLKYGDVTCGLIISGSVIAERCSGLDASGAAELRAFTFQ